MTLQEIEKELRILGCSDGNCCVLRPTGMHTNGGCRCARQTHAAELDRQQLSRLSKALRLHQQRADTIRADERAKVEAEVAAERALSDELAAALLLMKQRPDWPHSMRALERASTALAKHAAMRGKP